MTEQPKSDVDGQDHVLDVRDLRVEFATAEDSGGGVVTAVDGLSFHVAPGEILSVVGESGSGKSTTAMALLRLLAPNARISGSVILAGQDVLALQGEQLRTLRGNRAGMVFQEPMTALNPLQTVGRQLAEALRNHDPHPRRHRHYYGECAELLGRVGIDRPERRLRQYPHELSGGLRQRVLIAIAISCRPELIIADEPTTALDVTVQAGILDLLRAIRDETGAAILLITHNMGVVADIADRILVMHDGRLAEQAPVDTLFSDPGADYTRALLDAVPVIGDRDGGGEVARIGDEKAAAVLELTDLSVSFGVARNRQRVVDGVSLRIASGEMLGLVGESGSGKSTIGGCALGLVSPESGAVSLFGVDPKSAGRGESRRLRRRLGVVFQDPGSSLDPRMTVQQCVAEPLAVHRARARSERGKRVRELLDAVELPEVLARRYPHELSGGQRQRVSLARALALDPGLLIADEPTSALDVSVQATVLDLLARLQDELSFGCLFISHDLAVVDSVCDRVAVLHRGRIVEQGDRSRILGAPSERYTKELLMSSPVADPAVQRRRRSERLAGAGT